MWLIVYLEARHLCTLRLPRFILLVILEDRGKTTKERNVSAISFFCRDTTYGPKHHHTRNKALPSTRSREDHENIQFNVDEVNSSHRNHQIHSINLSEDSKSETSITLAG